MSFSNNTAPPLYVATTSTMDVMMENSIGIESLDETRDLMDNFSENFTKNRRRRRRSSTFRPGYEGYPQDIRRLGRGLEGLPLIIQSKIFSYLDTGDVLNMCLVSKLVYFPAILQLYHRIIIWDDAEMISEVKKYTTLLEKNYGTLIHTSKLEQLLLVLCGSRKLALEVKCLVFIGEIDSSQIMRSGGDFLNPLTSLNENLHENLQGNAQISQIPQPFQNHTIGNLLHHTLFNHLKLHDFIFPSLPFSSLSSLTSSPNFNSIRSLSISCGLYNDNPTPLNLPNLTHLRVSYKNEKSFQISMEILASSLISSLPHVISLEFIESQDKEKLEILNSLNNLSLDQISVTWVYFFISLRRRNVHLSLESLALDGNIGNQASDIAGLVAEVIDLSLLRDLQLNIQEKSHLQSTHQEFMESFQNFQESSPIPTSFLSLLTIHTPSLEGLAINPTYNCLFCQHYSTIQTLQHILPHKLLDLLVNFESPSLHYANEIISAICNFQTRVCNLRVYDKSRAINDQRMLRKCLQSQELISLYEHALYYDDLIQNVLSQTTFTSQLSSLSDNFLINDVMLRFIELSAPAGLTEFLAYYLNFGFSPFISSRFDIIRKLPCLENLNLLGLHLFVAKELGGRPKVMYVMNSGLMEGVKSNSERSEYF